MEETLYHEHLNLIRKVCWEQAKLFQYDYEELFSLSSTVFMKAVEEYDESRGKFSTFLVILLKREIRKYIRKFQKPPSDEKVPVIVSNITPANHCNVRTIIETVSDEGKHILNLVLNTPEEISETLISDSPREIRGAIVEHMRKEGYSWSKIWDGMREVKRTVRKEIVYDY